MLLVVLTGFVGLSGVALVQWRNARAQAEEVQRQKGRAQQGWTEADAQTAAAQTRAREVARRQAAAYARDGCASYDAGDLSTALLWFARAVEAVDAYAPEAEDARIRFATVLGATNLKSQI